MSFVQLDNVSLAFGERTLFKDVNLTISSGSRTALCGANGSGKTTLMKIAAGLVEADDGRIIRPQEARVAYLPQSDVVHRGRTLWEEVESVFSFLQALAAEAEDITMALEKGRGDQTRLLTRYQEIQDELEAANWDRRDARMERVLTGLGFKKEQLRTKTDAFSGGWQMRIALAKVLLTDSDVLLLDEPTNYLDLEAREWLRDFLGRFTGGLLLVSHDRVFLDETADRVAELQIGRLKLYQGNYSTYEVFLEKERTNLEQRHRRQQEEIKHIETFITRFRYKDSKAAQVQSRIKMLEKMQRIELPQDLKKVRFSFPPAPRSGRIVLRAEGLGRRYGDTTVFRDLDLVLERGTRMAVVGVNGAGKTTLLRIVSGKDKHFDGAFTLGEGVKVGYFSQDVGGLFDGSATVLEEAGRDSPVGEAGLRSLLGAFLFRGDDVHKKVGVLSGGELSRLGLIKTLLEPVNLLILDEPTNHLDLSAKDVLLRALKKFGGTLLIVSHDRYFLRNIADRVLELSEGRARFFHGDYEYFRRRREQMADFQVSRESPECPSPSRSPRMNHEEQKLRKSALRGIQRTIHDLTENLEALETEAAELREKLELPENYSDPARAGELEKALTAVGERIKNIGAAWEEAEKELEYMLKNPHRSVRARKHQS